MSTESILSTLFSTDILSAIRDDTSALCVAAVGIYLALAVAKLLRRVLMHALVGSDGREVIASASDDGRDAEVFAEWDRLDREYVAKNGYSEYKHYKDDYQ